MASSSSHKSLLQDNSCHVVEEEEQEALDQDDYDDHQGWLQLGLGLGVGFGSTRALKTSQQQQQHNSSSNPLFPYSATTTTTQSVSSSSFCLSTQFQAHHHHHHHQVIRQLGVGFGNEGARREIDLMKLQPNNNCSTNNYHNLWANYKNGDHENLLPSSSSSWPWHMESSDQGRFLGVYDDDDHDWQMPVDYSSSSSNIRISARPNSGLWFTLSASTNRREGEGEEGLPQVPKAYIRVKDENVTVSMVKKYLVRKLGLSNEAEIDVYCMGQKLAHTQSLKQVRDGVWLPRLVESVNSAAGADGRTTADCHHSLTYHLLSLHYGRTCL